MTNLVGPFLAAELPVLIAGLELLIIFVNFSLSHITHQPSVVIFLCFSTCKGNSVLLVCYCGNKITLHLWLIVTTALSETESYWTETSVFPQNCSETDRSRPKWNRNNAS